MSDWFVLRTEPRKEFAVEEILRRRGLRTFCPVETKWRRCGRRRRSPVSYPMLPRYVFAGGADPWDVVHTFDGRGVQGVVTVNGRPGLISQDAVERLARISGGLVPTRTRVHRAFQVGDLVEIAGKGFQHLAVPILSIKGETARVLITLFGAPQEVDVPVSQLDAA